MRNLLAALMVFAVGAAWAGDAGEGETKTPGCGLEFRMVVSENAPVYGRQLVRVRQMYPDREMRNLDVETLEPVPDDDVGEDGKSFETGRTLFDWLPLPVNRPGGSPEFVLVRKPVELDGGAIASAKAEPDPEVGAWRLAIEFTPEGAEAFARLTKAMVGQRLAIVWNGRLLSAPVIRAEIEGGHAVITGNFDKDAAEAIAASAKGVQDGADDATR